MRPRSRLLEALVMRIWVSGAVAAALLCSSTAWGQSVTVDVGTPEQQAQMRAASYLPIYCEGEKDCSDKWAKAAYLVGKWSAYRIQIQTDILIQTYGPVQSPKGSAIVVHKIPDAGNRYKIMVDVGCVSMPFCGMPSYVIKSQFVLELMGNAYIKEHGVDL